MTAYRFTIRCQNRQRRAFTTDRSVRGTTTRCGGEFLPRGLPSPSEQCEYSGARALASGGFPKVSVTTAEGRRS